jgi:hypothetical protein
MDISRISALSFAVLLAASAGATAGPVQAADSEVIAPPQQEQIETAAYRRYGYHHHWGRHYHHRRPYHHRHHGHYAWGPRIFSVAYEWRCNPLYHTECFYPGPYVEFPQFYQ